MNEGIKRTNVLLELLSLKRPIDAIQNDLRNFKWDTKSEHVVLTRQHLYNVLNRYCVNDLSENDIRKWADLVEVREDICFEPEFEEIIRELLFQLSTPELEGKFTKANAKYWLDRLLSSDER